MCMPGMPKFLRKTSWLWYATRSWLCTCAVKFKRDSTGPINSACNSYLYNIRSTAETLFLSRMERLLTSVRCRRPVRAASMIAAKSHDNLAFFLLHIRVRATIWLTVENGDEVPNLSSAAFTVRRISGWPTNLFHNELQSS